MENRKPFHFKNSLILYNLFQVIFSTWLFYEVRQLFFIKDARINLKIPPNSVVSFLKFFLSEFEAGAFNLPWLLPLSVIIYFISNTFFRRNIMSNSMFLLINYWITQNLLHRIIYCFHEVSVKLKCVIIWRNSFRHLHSKVNPLNKRIEDNSNLMFYNIFVMKLLFFGFFWGFLSSFIFKHHTCWLHTKLFRKKCISTNLFKWSIQYSRRILFFVCCSYTLNTFAVKLYR